MTPAAFIVSQKTPSDVDASPIQQKETSLYIVRDPRIIHVLGNAYEGAIAKEGGLMALCVGLCAAHGDGKSSNSDSMVIEALRQSMIASLTAMKSVNDSERSEGEGKTEGETKQGRFPHSLLVALRVLVTQQG